MRSAGRLSTVGWEFAISVIACFFAGFWADKKFGTSPWLTLGGLVLGMMTGFWTLYKVTRALQKESEEAERNERGRGQKGDE